MADLTPYASAIPLMGPRETWMSPEDSDRIAAYAVYEAIYRNVPEAFKLVQRGDEQNPIYIPSARTIIEAKNRFLCPGWTYAIVPGLGSDADKQMLAYHLDQLFRREILRAKFNTQKRWGLVRGDSVWQILADEEKEEGRRISVYEVDPASYFPIYDPWNPERVIGVHLVDQVMNDGGKVVIKRQTYRKDDAGGVTYELSWWEVGAWDDRDPDRELKPAESKDIPEGEANAPVAYELPDRITSLPVYHVKNNRSTGSPYGTSDLAGFETLIAGINQTMSDEEITLAMQGLGLYWTNSSPPVDDDGNESNWRFGPGWVLEIDEDSTFGRIGGVGSVQPMLDHVGAISSAMREASGVPDIAVGKVDSTVAESGIALAFHMGPLLAQNREKEEEILGKMDHMLFDLITMWLPEFEGFDTPARAISTTDDPLPTNRKAVLEEVVMMLSTEPPLISPEYARTIIQEKLGYDFPDEMAGAIVEQAKAMAQARNVDPFAERTRSELNNPGQGA